MSDMPLGFVSIKRPWRRECRECAKLWCGHAERASWVWSAIGLKPLCQ